MDRKRQLEEQVVQLSRQVDEMRVRLAALEGGSGDRASATTPRSRRDLLKLGGAAALGVAGAVGAAALGTVPAQAANGGALTMGQANLAESPTTLTGDGASGAPTPVLQVNANGSTAPITPLLGPLQGIGTSGVNAEGV